MKPRQYNEHRQRSDHSLGENWRPPPNDAVHRPSLAHRDRPPLEPTSGRRRAFVTAGLATAGWLLGGLFGARGGAAASNRYRLPATDNLATLHQEHPGKALLLAFFMDGCPYCHRIDQAYLGVMHDHADYRERVVMRHIRLARGARLVGFDGQEIDVATFAGAFSVRVAPTLVAFDADAQPVGEPLVGIRNLDFYGFDLDRLIDTATG